MCTWGFFICRFQIDIHTVRISRRGILSLHASQIWRTHWCKSLLPTKEPTFRLTSTIQTHTSSTYTTPEQPDGEFTLLLMRLVPATGLQPPGRFTMDPWRFDPPVTADSHMLRVRAQSTYALQGQTQNVCPYGGRGGGRAHKETKSHSRTRAGQTCQSKVLNSNCAVGFFWEETDDDTELRLGETDHPQRCINHKVKNDSCIWS